MQWFDYNKYLASSAWRKRRKRLIADVAGCCQRCGKIRKSLEIHHLIYDRIGNELDADLMVVCSACHKALEFEKTVLGGINA